jgi:hypothetical protein
MTAPEVLALVLEAGGRVVRVDPPRLLVPRRLRPLVEEHRVELRELLRNQAQPAARDFYWPDVLLGVGPRTVGPFTRCARCPASAHPYVAGTWVSFGGVPLCQPHAAEAARA